MRLEIALAQFRPAKRDPHASLRQMAGWFARVQEADPAPDLLLFPETSLTGYFLEGGVREHALAAGDVLRELGRTWEAGPAPKRRVDVALGFYEVAGHRIYNSALYAELGDGEPRLVHVHRKVFLPTYGVFQEERFVEAGHEVSAFDTRWGRAALLICEDAFHSLSPTLAALDGAQLLLVPSASPARGAAPGQGRPGNLERWERLARGAAEEHGVAVAVTQLVGFEGGKGFPGGSALYGPRGELRRRGPLWEEALVCAGLDLDELTAARVESPLLADLERALPRLLGRGAGGAAVSPPDIGPEVAARGSRAEGGDAPAPTGHGPEEDEEPEGGPATARRTTTLATAHETSLLAIDEGLVADWLIRFLREEIRERRGFERAVVGLSGGVDSSLTAALCARALGPDAVTGFLMPYRTSSPESEAHAKLVAETFGIPTRRIEITDAVDGYIAAHERDADDTRRGNVMARVRMIVLFDQAAKLGALPVGTGNKSERLLGYFTWHADDSPPINPLGDLFKTQVWALARHLGIPDPIVEKPATADLIRGQTDEEDLGIAYTEADLILHHLLTGRTPEWLAAAGFDRREVELVRGRLEGTHWKRHLPTVAMLSATTIGEWYLRPVDY